MSFSQNLSVFGHSGFFTEKGRICAINRALFGFVEGKDCVCFNSTVCEADSTEITLERDVITHIRLPVE